MTPHDINVLLHHHCVVGPWPLGETSAYKSSRAWMFNAGLLDSESGLAMTTDRGAALVTMLCSTPMPKQAFVDPRTDTVIDNAP